VPVPEEEKPALEEIAPPEEDLFFGEPEEGEILRPLRAMGDIKPLSLLFKKIQKI